MGLLRLLLALGVASEHAGNTLFAASYTAVQIFYMISGFYMALILSSSRYQSAWLFYGSRATRLIPVYWMALVIGVVVAISVKFFAGTDTTIARLPDHLARYFDSDLPLFIWGVFANLFVLSSDFAWFIKAEGAGHATNLLIQPPVWTLALEIYFYILCPFLIRLRSSTLLLIVFGIIAFRVVGYTYGMDANPYHARFFPFELLYFLSGMLAYRLYENKSSRFRQFLVGYGGIALGGLYLAGVFYFYEIVKAVPLPKIYGFENYLHSITMCVLGVPAIIALFSHTKKIKIDRFIGELSYPIYILHYGFVSTLLHTKILPAKEGFWLVMGMTVVCSIILILAVQNPVDRWRINRFTAH